AGADCAHVLFRFLGPDVARRTVVAPCADQARRAVNVLLISRIYAPHKGFHGLRVSARWPTRLGETCLIRRISAPVIRGRGHVRLSQRSLGEVSMAGAFGPH